MIFDLMFFWLLFYLSIPAVSGYFAYCYGKSFWLWFALGFVFPGIAHFSLYLLVSVEDKRREKNNQMTFEEEHYMEDLLDDVIEEIDQRPVSGQVF